MNRRQAITVISAASLAACRDELRVGTPSSSAEPTASAPVTPAAPTTPVVTPTPTPAPTPVPTTPVDGSPPPAPTLKTAVALDPSRIQLDWTAVTDVGTAGLAGYYVWLNGAKAPGIGLIDKAQVSKILIGLNPTEAYRLQVSAADALGNESAASNAISVTTPAALAAGPLKVNSGTLTIGQGVSADLQIDVGFTPSVIIFYAQADFYERPARYGSNLPASVARPATTISHSVSMGAYDGASQWAQQHGVGFADGRREGFFYPDAVYDASINGSGLGARVVGKSISGNIVTLAIERPTVSTDGVVTMNWIAIGGCRAKVGTFSVPPGSYHANPPQGVTVAGLSFQPKGLIFAPWRQTNFGSGGSNFFTATVGTSIGFASGSARSQQASIGASDGYQGHLFSFAYQGCLAGPSRQDRTDTPTYLATLNRFTSDGFVLDFQSADDFAPNDRLTYVALDCECFAGQTAMLTSTGSMSVTGAPFTPAAALFGAVPSVDSNYTTPWTALNYGTNGDENVSLGFAVNSATGLKQGGISFYDKAGYDASGALIVVNGHEFDSTAMHDGSALAFSDAVLKGQKRIDFQTFQKSGEVAVAQFLTDGVRLEQVQASSRAGKIAFLLLGSSAA